MRHRDSATVVCGIGTEGISHVAEIVGTGQLARVLLQVPEEGPEHGSGNE